MVFFFVSQDNAPTGHTSMPPHSLALSQILKLINTAMIKF
jgi:hypothetical protein